MGFTIFICVLAFAGLMALLHFGVAEAERARSERPAGPLRQPAAPTPRGRDELVLLIEHRIEADLRDAAAAFRRATAGPRRT